MGGTPLREAQQPWKARARLQEPRGGVLGTSASEQQRQVRDRCQGRQDGLCSFHRLCQE